METECEWKKHNWEWESEESMKLKQEHSKGNGSRI